MVGSGAIDDVAAGGLMNYSPDPAKMYHRAAYYLPISKAA